MSVHGALGHCDIRATFKGCHIGHVVCLWELCACVLDLWFKEPCVYERAVGLALAVRT